MADYTFNDTVGIELESVSLVGDLMVAEKARGVVVFSHGSGSSRLSSRNRYVATHLQRAGFATLLFDLLTEEGDQVYANRFDIPLITQRLVASTHWLEQVKEVSTLPVGYFGASTGAASALGAAAALGNRIKAVVSRGGRPDLAMAVLHQVKAPTLLIVGGHDEPVISMNKEAYDKLRCEKKMEIVPGATHLFEEPGTLGRVTELATGWFKEHLVKGR